MKLNPPRLLLVLAAGIAGGWALTMTRAQDSESPDAAAPASDAAEAARNETPLFTLDWLVGSWVGETETGAIEFTCRYTKNDAFLIRSFRASDESEESLSGMQVVAWDPVQETIRSWTFDSNGGFGEAVWKQDGDRYSMRSKYTLADGGRGSALNQMTYVDADSFIWQSTHREIDGELLADTPAVVVSRMASAASNETEQESVGGL